MNLLTLSPCHLVTPGPCYTSISYSLATNTTSRTYVYARFSHAPAIVFDAPRRSQLLRAGPACPARRRSPERAGPRAGSNRRAGAGRYLLRSRGDEWAAAHRSDGG